MSTFYMLVGLPGSGKSTWVDRFKRKHNTELDHMSFKNKTVVQTNLTVVSTDDIIETIAKEHRLTYNDVFDNITYSFAEKMSHRLAKFAFDRNDIVIWDQTNLSKKSRVRKLELVPSHYSKIAVVFPEPVNLQERLLSRVGKTIPDNVMAGMRKSYQMPEFQEGFDTIIMSSDNVEKYA